MNLSPTVEYFIERKGDTHCAKRIRITYYMTEDYLEPLLNIVMPIMYCAFANTMNYGYFYMPDDYADVSQPKSALCGRRAAGGGIASKTRTTTTITMMMMMMMMMKMWSVDP